MEKGMRTNVRGGAAVLAALLLLGCPGGAAQEGARPESAATPNEAAIEQAWDILRADYVSPHARVRAPVVSLLGLLPDNPFAETMAEAALTDKDARIRAAGASALGMMRARQAAPKLRQAEEDADPAAALAAANALLQLGDDEGYEAYYAVLTGKRKGHPGLVAGEEETVRQTLQDPKKMAELSFVAGLGFVPFAGVGWETLVTVTKNDNTPVRAAAAKKLAPDPDPKTADALVEAASDKSWIVRAAALEAIALRNDPALLPQVAPHLADAKKTVRLVAAACVIRLGDLAAKSAPPQK